MSANRLLSLPALQHPYTPSEVQKNDSTSEDDSDNSNSFADSSGSKLSSELCIRQAGASDVSKSIPVITSDAAPLQPELRPDNRQHLASDSNDTN
eukprot:2813461-Pyramimonas_sp.AAC.1